MSTDDDTKTTEGEPKPNGASSAPVTPVAEAQLGGEPPRAPEPPQPAAPAAAPPDAPPAAEVAAPDAPPPPAPAAPAPVAAPPAPTAAGSTGAPATDDDWEEQPGDDIGNRLPGAGPRDDIGNRRGGGRFAPPPRTQAQSAFAAARAPQGRPAARFDARAPRSPSGGPAAGAPPGQRAPHPGGDPRRGGAPQVGGPRRPGGPGAPPQVDRGPRTPARGAAPSASGAATAERPDGSTTDPGAIAGAAPVDPALIGASPGEGAAAEGAPAEGASPDAAAAPPGATAPGEAGVTPAKKRRRRRRRKGAGAGAAPGGAPGAAPAGEGAEGAPAEGAEGEGHEGEEHEAEVGAEGAEPGASEGEAGGEGGQPQPGAPGRGAKRKRSRGRGGEGPQRERPAFGVGEEVFGKVVRVTDHAVWVDIAGKATGLFDRRELSEGDVPAEGDQFIATVSSNGVRGGMLMLSRAAARFDEARAQLEAASQSGDIVEGFVTGAVKGGLEVDLGGIRAFAPASHVDLRHGADLAHLVGERLEFTVAQYAKKGRDVVVSRKRMLEGEAKKARAEALSKIEPGSVHKGVVRTVMQWGAFVALPDAGGVEGLVHMTEASHDRGAKLLELFKPGAEIEVKVLRVDERGKLWLSRKAVVADPWDAVKQKYAVGSRHKGKVARLQPFGAFIELEPGVDGLCHTADLTLKPINHPSDVVKVGDEIDVVVASCDGASHKIGLHPAPPPGEEDEPRQRVQQYKAVKCVVTQITEGGLVVRILGVTGRSARAFIPASHTGTPRGGDLRKDFPIGTRLEAKVLEIDPRRGEAKLSVRALKDDAEKQAYQQYRQGVAREAKFGTFADLLKKS